jgi:hypothetical protein
VCGGEHEITVVVWVFGVDHDHHPACAQRGDRRAHRVTGAV